MACDLADLGSPTDMVDGSGKGSRRVPVANLPLITIQALLCFPPPGGISVTSGLQTSSALEQSFSDFQSGQKSPISSDSAGLEILHFYKL